MPYKIKYKSFKLLPLAQNYLESFHSRLIDGAELFVTLEIANFENEAASKKVADLFSTILQEYLEKNAQKPLHERFEEALKKLNSLLSQKRAKQSGWGAINALVAVLEGNLLHLSKTGSAESYLLSKNELAEISEGLYPETTKEEDGFFINIASGKLTPENKLVFSTKRLLRFVGRQDLLSIFQLDDFAESMEELKEVLLLEDTKDLGISGFCFQQLEPFGPKQQEYVTALFQKASPVIQKIKEVFFKLKAGLQNPETRPKYLVIILVIVIALFLISLLFPGGNRQNESKLKQYATLLKEAQEELQVARNLGIGGDKARAKISLEQAKSNLIQLKNERIFTQDATNLLKEIKQEEEQLDNLVRLPSPSLFAALSQKFPEIAIKGLVNFQNAFYVYDANSLIGPILDNNPQTYKQTPSDEGDIIISADYFVDQNDLVVLFQPSRIAEFKNHAFLALDTEDKTWKKGKEIKTYASRRYLYLFDPENNQIWRYSRGKQKYSIAEPWLTGQMDITSGVSFAIDGSIYILKNNGEILRFYSKQIQPIKIVDGPSDSMSKIDPYSKIYTNEDLRRIYILDHLKSRVLVFRKTPFENPTSLVYEKQYLFEGKDLKDLYVPREENALYVADKQKIYKIELQF